MSCTLLVCKVLIQCQGHHIEAPVGHTVNGTLVVANVARLIRKTATQRPCFYSLPAMSDLKNALGCGERKCGENYCMHGSGTKDQMGRLEADSLPSLGGSL